MAIQSIGFIGLGIMGLPMAGHLLGAGLPLTVHTRTKSKADSLLARGARWADCPQEVARNAEAVFLCLPDTPDVERAVLGEDGVLSGAKEGDTLIIDHSTISPAATREINERVTDRGVAYLD